MKRTILSNFIFIATLLTFCIQESYAARGVPDDNLSYPVLILIGKTSGSGFFLNYKEQNVYFVTARHVVYKPSESKLKKLPKNLIIPNEIIVKLHYDPDKKILILNGILSESERDILLELSSDTLYKNSINDLYKKSKEPKLRDKTCKLLSYPHDIKENSRNIMLIDLDLLNNNNKISFHTEKDIAVIEIGKNEEGRIKTYQGVTSIAIAKTGVTTLHSDNTHLFNDALVGNDIYLFGFPTSIASKNPDLDIDRPLVRKGILSGKNDNLKTLIIDCPVHHGNSGSLVIEKEFTGLGNYSVQAIGIAVRYVPVFEKGVVEVSSTKEFITYSNSGYSIVEPIDYILELIKIKKPTVNLK